MKINLDDCHYRVPINGLYNYRNYYGEAENDFIDMLILRLVDEHEKIKTN